MLQVTLLEKDPSLAWLYREELEDAGFKVKVHSGLDEAYYHLRNNPTHMLVTDTDTLGACAGWCVKLLREVHKGPLLVLESKDRSLRSKCGVPVLAKTSDTAPLIRSLRQQAMSLMWGMATKGLA